MKNYKIAKPPQKFLKLPQIHSIFGQKPVVAYSCTVKNNTPTGGYIIAVQNEENTPTDGLKLYMKQLKAKFRDKEPIYYICIKENEIIYDKGEGDVATLPPIEEKSLSKEHKALESMSDELLAMAIATVFRQEELTAETPKDAETPQEDE